MNRCNYKNYADCENLLSFVLKYIFSHKMVQHLSLEAALPILKSRRKTIVLLSCQLSMMEIVRNPTPDKIVRACKSLYAKAKRQDSFNIDFWGEQVAKRSKNEIMQMQQRYLDRGLYPDKILAALMTCARTNRIYERWPSRFLRYTIECPS